MELGGLRGAVQGRGRGLALADDGGDHVEVASADLPLMPVVTAERDYLEAKHVYLSAPMHSIAFLSLHRGTRGSMTQTQSIRQILLQVRLLTGSMGHRRCFCTPRWMLKTTEQEIHVLATGFGAAAGRSAVGVGYFAGAHLVAV